MLFLLYGEREKVSLPSVDVFARTERRNFLSFKSFIQIIRCTWVCETTEAFFDS